MSDRSLLDLAGQWLGSGRPVALATVVESWGSAPQPVGSHMIIAGDGSFMGAVSGGCVEGAVIAEALDMLQADVLTDSPPRLLDYGVDDETAWSLGLPCGGRIRVFVECLEVSGSVAGGKFQDFLAMLNSRQPVARISDVRNGPWRVAGPDDTSLGETFRRDRSMMADLGGAEHFVRIYNPPLRLIIVGAVAIAQALCPQAQALDYEVTLVDPRAAFATPERFAGIDCRVGWPDEILPGLGLDSRTAVAVLTHDAKIDDAALMMALGTDVFYIGALGSRKNHGHRCARLAARGVDEQSLARIHGPIGMSIGAQGAAEIALSIMADLTRTLRLGDEASAVS